jgi:outer membrane cobalamin receptor
LALTSYLVAQQTPGTEPPPLHTSITVVENIETESPANVTALDSTALSQAPGVNLDDRLRQIPGFTLFRRSSSLVAHPTTQGVSLRGLGSSGASRTLVLWDGVPVNDPFGGWVYWTQFDPDEISRVELERGASTSAFGDRAMSGVIGLFSRPPEPLHLNAAWRMGNFDTREASLGLSQAWSRTFIAGAARGFTTGGYYIVPGSIRGAIDRPAGVRFTAGDVRLSRYTRLGVFHLKFQALAEDRANGTMLTRNSTSLGTVSARYERQFARDTVSLLAFHTREGFHSTFSSVNAARSVETLAFTQSVTSEAAGGLAIWQRRTGRWEALAGADVNRAAGTSVDHLLPSGLRSGGGSQLQHGVFAQANASAGPARFFAGLRHSFAGTGSQFLSPSAGAVIGHGRLRARASVYRAFRAPTLNELYRTFRVGNTETQANPNLRPETLLGSEAGVDWIGEHGSARITAYRNSMDRLITNVTLAAQGNSILRQRQNAAAAISRGVEAALRRTWRNWTGDLAYLFADSRYATGPRIAQVPRHQGSAQLDYQRRGTTVSVQLRAYGTQFDDDLNRFRLPGYAALMFTASRRLTASLRAEAAIENALDRTWYTAFTPTPNTGQPRMFRIGLVWDGKL